MRVFITVDIEGANGLAVLNELVPGSPETAYFRNQLTKEVAGACRGALEAGAEKVFVRDSHAFGTNIIPDGLPEDERVFLCRGYPHDLYIMMGGIQYDKYDAALFIASHCGGYSFGSNVSHTFNPMLDRFTINGIDMSEFTLGAFMAGLQKVPIVFLSGDRAACEEAEALIPGITTVTTHEAICGRANVSNHPNIAVQRIQEGVRRALSGDYRRLVPELPEHFEVIMRFKEHARAFHFSFYPGVEQVDSKTLKFRTENYLDVLRLIHFTLIPIRPGEFEA